MYLTTGLYGIHSVSEDWFPHEWSCWKWNQNEAFQQSLGIIFWENLEKWVADVAGTMGKGVLKNIEKHFVGDWLKLIQFN